MPKEILRKVLLEEAETRKDDIALTGAFVRAAEAQGFTAEWVEAVFAIALLNHTALFRRVLLDHIETMPAENKAA